MYAAAGGASLASRQARQRQRQQKKTQQLQAKLHPPKASVLSVAEPDASTPTRQSRQFHQLPTSYLRAPQGQGRKLSASYTAQSKLLLPIDEGSDTQSVLQMRMHSHVHMHHHAHSHHAHPHQQQHQFQLHHHHGHHGRVSPRLVHRHSGSSSTSFHHSHLPKSATATLPLVSQVEPTPPTTPSGAVAARASSVAATTSTTTTTGTGAAPHMETEAMVIPAHQHDAIIVTPATPMASPGHEAKLRDDLPEAAAEKQPLTAAEDDDEAPMEPPSGPLERKCSVYRMRRSDAFEQERDSGSGIMRRQLKDLQFHQQQQYEPLVSDEPPQLVFKGLPNGRKWQPCAYCEEGICVCEHIEIQDASLGGSSDDEDFLGVLRGPSTFANAFLYVGLGTVALGLVIAFVGTGEKGFKTVELRLIGPSLIGLGLICCILRILFCICPSHCISSKKKTRKKNGNKIDADHTTSLLRGESKRVSIARGPAMQPKYPITHKRSNSKMLNEGMEALRQIATTSLFMQNEQKPSMNRVVPIIKEPENPIEAPLEMKRLETALNICEISEDEDEDDEKNTTKNITSSKAKTTTTTTTTTPAQTDATLTAAKTATTTATSPTITQAPAATTSNNKSNNNNATAITTTSTLIDERRSSLSSANKHARQRVPLNHQQSTLTEQSHSLSSSSTVKGSVDEDLLMETSLMVIQPTPTVVSEARPPPVPPSSSTGAIPRQTATTATAAISLGAAPPAYPGLTFNRATSATATASTSTSTAAYYDLPSATPHTYAASARHATERESLIRGPLGMPLSALTASMSSYALPTTPAAPTSTSVTAPAPASARSITTTTAISLLPLPAPPLTTASATSATSAVSFNVSSIPGQVLDTAPSTSTYAAAVAAATAVRIKSAPSIASGIGIAGAGAAGGIATTSLSILLPPPTNGAAASMPAARITAPSFANTSFKFPAPLSSSSASSSASSNGRAPAYGAQAAVTTTSGNSTTTSYGGATLAPAPSVNKFEPELLLSPAKLGQ